MRRGRPSTTSDSRSTGARSSPSSARTGPARRRWRSWSPTCTSRPAAPFGGTACDVRQVDADQLRTAVTVVFQDFERYNLSAADNIGLGDVTRRDDRPDIVMAAQRSGADRFLRRLPEGYDSILGRMFDNGQDLSVGQWQRVAVARAFFRDAPFVILDEPTAALDARAEHDLFERIRSLFVGRTVVLISHRFSTVRSADRIYVLDRGRVTEHGTHDGLMASAGTYAELFQLQASAFVEAGQA